MIKKIFYSILLFFFFIPIVQGERTDYSYLKDYIQMPDVQAKNVLLYNKNDEKIVYEKNSTEQISIASLTKIMTAVVALEKINDLNLVVQVPEKSFEQLDGYTKAGLKAGDFVTYKDLLYATLLPSGADAAQALAILTYNDIETFVSIMNEKAKSLDMLNTHFSNPVGRDSENNYSTLEDMLKLLLYALENEEFYKAYTTRNYVTLNNIELESTLVAPAKINHLNIDIIKGSKSGFTSQAGLCLTSLAINNGITYLLLTANSSYQNNYPNHILDSLTIYNYVFTHFSYVDILKNGQTLKKIPVEDAFIKEYEIKSKVDVPFYLEKNFVDNLSYEYQGIEKLNSKIKQNTKLGVIKIKYQDQELYSYDVYLQEKIKYKYTKPILFSSLLVLIVFVLIFLKKK